MRNNIDFLAEIEGFAAEQRALIEAEVDGFDTDPVAQKQRIKDCYNDYELFARTYFPHYIQHTETSDFHDWAFEEIPKRIDADEGTLTAMAAPRGEAKSTIVTQIFNLWCVVTDRKHMIVIVMDTFDQATEMLEVIKAELTTNPRLLQDYPHATGGGRVWQVGIILTANNIKIKVGGAGKKLRGAKHGPHRVDLLCLDDLENDENVKSPEQRNKLQKWINSTALNLGPPDGSMDVLYVGTILHYDSVLSRILRSPSWDSVRFKAIKRYPDRMDLWDRWEEVLLNDGKVAAQSFYTKNKVVMDKGAEVSWDGVRPILRLMLIRSIDHHAFDSEYQNDPTNVEESWFQDIKFWSERKPNLIFFGAIDPSLGKRNKNRDPSAILIGGLDRDTGILDVFEAEIAKRLPDLIIERSIQLQKQYNCAAWAVETVQFQEFMYTELLKRSAQRNISFPAIPVKPTTDKDLRIQSLSPQVNNGFIRLHNSQGVLIEQLTHYPEADHDDGPDALEMLWQIAKTYSAPYEYMGADDLGDDEDY